MRFLETVVTCIIMVKRRVLKESGKGREGKGRKGLPIDGKSRG